MTRSERRPAGERALWFALGAISGVAVMGAVWIAFGSGRKPRPEELGADAPPGAPADAGSVTQAAAGAPAAAEPGAEPQEETAMTDRDLPEMSAPSEGTRLRDLWLRERLVGCRLPPAGEGPPAPEAVPTTKRSLLEKAG